jgi:hypothetical protein
MQFFLAFLLGVAQVFGSNFIFVGTSWLNTKALNLGTSNSSKYLSAGDVHNTISWASTFSVCFFATFETMAGDGIIFSNETGAGTGYDFRFNGSDKLQWYSSPNAAATRIQVTSNATVSKSVYHHICVTHSGNSSATGLKFWVDGSSVATTTNFNTSASDWNGGTVFNIGSYNSGAGAWYKGKLDEFNIWNIELDSSKVAELYNSGTPRNPTTTTFWANNTSYYRLGDLTDSTTTIVDLGNTGGVNLTGNSLVSGDFTSTIPP